MHQGLSDELLARIHTARALPSPPIVTARLIELGENPDTNIAQIVEVLNTDAALVARLLRLANSPLYAGRRRTENLRQAVVALGLDTVLTASLSLTLLNDRARQAGMSPELKQRSWTRSVHAAACAQNLAASVEGVTASDAFLAALLQDIGVQVVARLEPTTYEQVISDGGHDDLVAAEMAGVGADHAAIGGELLSSWSLPPRIVGAVRASHCLDQECDLDPTPLAAVVAISGWVADGVGGDPGRLSSAAEAARRHLDVDEAAFGQVVDDLIAVLPDLGQILNAKVPDSETLVEAAEELLLIRHAQAQINAAVLEKQLVAVTSIAEELKAQTRRDPLTGLANRRDVDDCLDREFHLAHSEGFPLSVLFIDFDNFKQVNDRFGHKVGDEVLIEAARRIGSGVRDYDLVGRIGGEEFIVILPGADRSGSEVVAERLIALFRAKPFEVGHNLSIDQTISIGVATMSSTDVNCEASDLIAAADRAMYIAKDLGKNQWQHLLAEEVASSSAVVAHV